MRIKNNYRILNECRLCESKNLFELIDFGLVPLGNNLQDENLEISLDEYPLKVMCCYDCNHFQLNCAVKPEILYATNYTYLSGIGFSFVRHIESYVNWIESKTNLTKSANILDIGSNDGTCLMIFKKKGYNVCGIDPARLAVNISQKKKFLQFAIFLILNLVKKLSKNSVIWT